MSPPGPCRSIEPDEHLQALAVFFVLGVVPYLVPVGEAGQVRVLGALACLQVAGGLGDLADGLAAAGQGGALARFQAGEHLGDGGGVGPAQDGVRFGGAAQPGVPRGVAFQQQLRAEGPQEQVAEVGGVRAEPPGLGQREDDVGGPVLQRVDRAAEPVDGLVGVADDDGLRRLVQDDARASRRSRPGPRRRR